MSYTTMNNSSNSISRSEINSSNSSSASGTNGEWTGKRDERNLAGRDYCAMKVKTSNGRDVECGAMIRPSCRCSNGSRICSNGHEFHYDIFKQKYVLGKCPREHDN